MAAPTLDELTVMAQALGLPFSAAQLARVLPEVQRLWEQARRLRELRLAAEEPATRADSE